MTTQNRITRIFSVDEGVVEIDLLTLVKTIKRQPRADLIDEISKEIDAIDAAIITDEEVPKDIVKFDEDF